MAWTFLFSYVLFQILSPKLAHLVHTQVCLENCFDFAEEFVSKVSKQKLCAIFDTGILFYCIDTTHFYNIYLKNQFSIRKYCFCLIFSCPKVFFSWKILGSRTSRHRLFKGQCHEIFAIFFSWIKAIWAPDKQAKMVLLNNSFLRRYSNVKFENSTPRSVILRRVENDWQASPLKC